jgi:hypothetical protein
MPRAKKSSAYSAWVCGCSATNEHEGARMKPVQDNPSRFADRREFAAIRVHSWLNSFSAFCAPPTEQLTEHTYRKRHK